jgi:2-oxoisovalerate dehydrogenase E1 component alpha subunit
VLQGWWSDELDKNLLAECRQLVRDALGKAEKQLKPALVHLFTDVYDTIPPHIEQQKLQLERHLKLHPDEYPIDIHSSNL